MTVRQNSRTGTYVTKRGSKDSQVVRTIVTPAGSFRTISKDVFDRAIRSANTALRQGEPRREDALGDARKR